MSDPKVAEAKHSDVYPYIDLQGPLKDSAKGKSVLIFGGGSGIGKAIAIAFAEVGAANVVISGRRLEALEAVKDEMKGRFPNTNVVPIAANATSVEEVDKVFSDTKSSGITIDILVNSQGARTGRSRLVDSEPDRWWADIEVYLKSPWLTTRAYIRSLTRPAEPPAEPEKFIINVTSLASNALMPLGTSYCLPKAALNKLTEHTAAEASPYGLQCIALHPGGVADTDTTKHSPAFMIPFFTEKVELASAVTVYCATPQANYLNGRYLDVRWDLEELEKQKEKIVKDDLLKMVVLGDARMPIPPQLWKTITG
ncbi:putative oxido [Cyphellophora attinorum]|uniref:Putative oxido n=1 Tax=Cyphellophora attinorum TaxID=1664694 RepID=A0A0N1H8M9_9EURO|nr:putative oxido [Phialophora attinorum]KPI38317.1 putative oxido [Phialophora attinorum]